VHGKRYAYKFDFVGLAQTIQHVTTVSPQGGLGSGGAIIPATFSDTCSKYYHASSSSSADHALLPSAAAAAAAYHHYHHHHRHHHRQAHLDLLTSSRRELMTSRRDLIPSSRDPRRSPASPTTGLFFGAAAPYWPSHAAAVAVAAAATTAYSGLAGGCRTGPPSPLSGHLSTHLAAHYYP